MAKVGEAEFVGDRYARFRALTTEEREARRLRVQQVIPLLPVPTRVVYDASEGAALIDVIEATATVEAETDYSAEMLWVKLPHGYATVEFLRMLFAVSG